MNSYSGLLLAAADEARQYFRESPHSRSDELIRALEDAARQDNEVACFKKIKAVARFLIDEFSVEDPFLPSFTRALKGAQDTSRAKHRGGWPPTERDSH